MSNSDPTRLDRIEALVESNARAIEALSASDAEAKKEQAKLYDLMSELAQSHADLAQSYANLARSNADVAQAQAKLTQAQADTKKEMYRMMGSFEKQNQELSKRQGEIVDILKLLVNQKSNQ